MARDALDVPPIRFADSGGARIAYQRWGDGDVHLVAIPPMAQNIEMAWEWPDIRVMLERFGSFATYTHFDKRGTGSSDRHSQVPGLDERVQDLLAVMDHAGIERAHLLGLSEGGPMTILAADSYPDRVLSLILYGTAPSLIPAHFDVERIAAGRQGRQRLIDTWGTPESVMVDVFAPSLADNDEFRRWHQVYERRSSSPQSLRELFDLYEVDVVSEILPRLQVPTLVLHRTGDPAVPLEVARNLAAAIPGARLIEHDQRLRLAVLRDRHDNVLLGPGLALVGFGLHLEIVIARLKRLFEHDHPLASGTGRGLADDLAPRGERHDGTRV